MSVLFNIFAISLFLFGIKLKVLKFLLIALFCNIVRLVTVCCKNTKLLREAVILTNTARRSKRFFDLSHDFCTQKVYENQEVS